MRLPIERKLVLLRTSYSAFLLSIVEQLNQTTF